MDWTMLLSALALVMMLVLFGPRAVHMMRHSPKADGQTWMQAIIPIALVGGFILFLMMAI